MLPEILAPAGSREALEAALKAGADAVYFGLDEGFNARARAQNFPLNGLPALVEEIHAARTRAYLTLNTLIFESELTAVQRIIVAAAQAGVDALIVQDPAVCLLARQLCPQLQIHASTQMTISSPEAAQLARSWGVTRVVLPRELSLKEIEIFARADTGVEMEVFIAGSLCMSWSGQCLSSEAWGGRSANRGQCAQACRHPYQLVVDGETRSLGPLAYLLSPQDLGGYAAIEQLLTLGVSTLKIEGRQKDADYVFHAIKAVQAWLEELPEEIKDRRLRSLQLAYSRGLSPGFFFGSQHQSLVPGRIPGHCGIFLGKVEHIRPPWVRVAGKCDLLPQAGMGVVFRNDKQIEPGQEPGGPIFAVTIETEAWNLQFGRPGPDLRQVESGDEVWVTSAPQVRRESQIQAQGEQRRWPLRLQVTGRQGELLKVSAAWAHGEAEMFSATCLQAARSGRLDAEFLQLKLGAWGDSSFVVEALEVTALAEGLFIPVSQLKQIRQKLRDVLQQQLRDLGKQTVSAGTYQFIAVKPLDSPVVLEPLCRTPEQLEAVIAEGFSGVTLDWMELVGLRTAVERARQAGLQVGLATVRIQKPGEEGYDQRLRALEPDWVLARHWGAVLGFMQYRPAQVHGDFSLNVSNSITAAELIRLGLDTVTVAHDLDRVQLQHLLTAFPPSRLSVTVHHHIPTFHTEHCVYAHVLSQGQDYRSCGRPCEKHLLELEDRKRVRHPVIVDVGCRNTVFNGAAQSCISLVPDLLSWGIRRLRIEFVRETYDEARRVLTAYRGVVAGDIDPSQARTLIGTHEQFGVSLGTMAVIG